MSITFWIESVSWEWGIVKAKRRALAAARDHRSGSLRRNSMTGQLRHLAWRKSSYSSSASNCVEVAALGWRTSSYSSDQANCVEVALGGPAIGVRDSKDPDGPVLAVPAGRWWAFLRGVATDDLDR